MLNRMDARQLYRWLKQLKTITPAREDVKEQVATSLPDQLGLELLGLLNKNQKRINNKYVTNHLALMWARCTSDQWDELLYLAERYQVPWPNIQYAEEVDRLLKGLEMEYQPDDDSEIPL